MNLNRLHQKVIAVARANPPSAAVPYAFEQRILARLANARAVDPWAALARVFWRVAAPCAGTAILLAAWTFSVAGNTAADTSTLWAADVETTVLAAMDSTGSSW